MPLADDRNVVSVIVQYWIFEIHYRLGHRSYDDGRMKPLPAPPVPGNTEAERMDNAVRKFLSVSKEAYLKEEDRLKKLRERRKRVLPQHQPDPLQAVPLPDALH